jgi:basic membrane protein A
VFRYTVSSIEEDEMRRKVLLGLVALLAAAAGSAAAAAVTADPVTVAFATGGSRKDGSWAQAWFEGTQQAQKALGTKAKVTFIDETNSVADYDKAAQAALAGGVDVWFYATAEVPQLVDKYATQFPDRWIGDVEAPRKTYPKNVFTVLPRFWEGTFRAGVLAALVSKSKQLGIVGGFDFPILTSEIEAFILGARYVNPKIKAAVTYINSFTDPVKAAAAAKAQVAAGADIIFSATDVNQGIYKVAREKKGTWVITQYFDSYNQAPDVILTSVIYNLQAVGKRIITLAANKQLKARHYTFGFKELGVGRLAPFHANAKFVPAAAKARLAQVTALIDDGQLCVPGPERLGKAGSASKLNPKAAVRC